MKLPLTYAEEGPDDPAVLDALRRRSRTSRRLTLDEALALARADGHEPVLPGDVPGGKSICLCTHRGDGSKSEHAGLIGHGYCTVPVCRCPKFSWRRFIWE